MHIEWRILVDPWLPGATAGKTSLERAAQAVVDAEGLPGRYQACVVLTDDRDIRRINRQTRGIDSATDVLSFPQVNIRRGADGPARIDPRRLRALLDPDTGCRHLGDVVISVERARAQAAEHGHGFRRELGYLLVHGICHLLGHDHVREEDKARMRAAEEAAMARAGLPREEI